MSTALDIISRALRLARVLGEGDSLTNEDAQNCLVTLNAMLDGWNIERLMIYQVRDEIFTLSPGTASYTIGTGGTFNTTRPVRVESAFLRRNGVDFPMGIIETSRYDQIAVKTVQSNIPFRLTVEHAYPLSTIIVHPVPTEANDLHLRTWTPLGSFSLTDSVALPPGYQDAITYNLATMVAPEYGMECLPKVTRVASVSKKNIKRMNYTPGLLAFDDAIINSRAMPYNIYSDGN